MHQVVLSTAVLLGKTPQFSINSYLLLLRLCHILFDTRSGNILSFLLPLFQEGQLSVTGESMCTKYWLTVRRSKPAQEKCG